MERTYKISSYSKYRFVLVVFLPIIILIIFIVPFIKYLFGENWKFISLIIISGLTLLNWFKTPKYLAKAVLQIAVDTETIAIQCICPFVLWNTQKEYTFTFVDIIAYKYEYSKNFETFWIQLINGEKIIIHRWFDDNDDDFDRFLSFFEKAVKKHNKINKEHPIVRKHSVMENKAVLILLAVVLLVVVVGSVILVVKYGVQDLKGIVFLLIALPSLIWTIFRVVRGLMQK